MNDSKEIMAQIKMLGSFVTEDTYNDRIQQGYELLVRLHDLGLEKELIYQSLLQYHNSLEDGLSRDWAADILDFVVWLVLSAIPHMERLIKERQYHFGTVAKYKADCLNFFYFNKTRSGKPNIRRDPQQGVWF